MPTDNTIAEPESTVPQDVVVRRAQLLYEQGHFEAARQIAADLEKFAPNRLPSLFILADALRELGRFDEALAMLSRVAELAPDNTRAAAARALCLFYKEDWKEAWRAFDVRFKLFEAPKVTTRQADGRVVPLPLWRGGPCPGPLLVMGEQGLGDTIQFARFLPSLVQSGIEATCIVQQRLFRLLETLNCDIQFRPIETPGSVAGIKAWTPLMHLPQALGLDESAAGLAPKIPYLKADPKRVARYRALLGTEGFKVGIVWQGNPDKRIDLGRSIPLSAFAPLIQIPNVRLVSLQVGAGTEQLDTVSFRKNITTLGDDFDAGPDGFLDSAAVMECLDLIVTIDSASGHLAGALGRPTFILLKRPGSDWRWLFNRQDSVWYPTVRLIRQKTPGDWVELMERVSSEIQRLLRRDA